MKFISCIPIIAAALTSCSTHKNTFDKGLEGWCHTKPLRSFEQLPDDGVPPPALVASDKGYDGDSMTLLAPKKGFTGDLRKYDGGMFAFDIQARNYATGLGAFRRFGVVTITSKSGATASRDLVPSNPTDDEWHTYFAKLTAEQWNVSPNKWREILSDVECIDIGFERNTTVGDETAFDNPTITNDPREIARIREKARDNS